MLIVKKTTSPVLSEKIVPLMDYAKERGNFAVKDKAAAAPNTQIQVEVRLNLHHQAGTCTHTHAPPLPPYLCYLDLG